MKRHCDVRSRKAVVLFFIHRIVRVMNPLTTANVASVEANIQQKDSCLHSDADEVRSGFIMKLTKLEHQGRAVIYKCSEILLADIWQERDRGSPKYDSNPKNLHVITVNEM
jgi:hypothetical protein